MTTTKGIDASQFLEKLKELREQGPTNSPVTDEFIRFLGQPKVKAAVQEMLEARFARKQIAEVLNGLKPASEATIKKAINAVFFGKPAGQSKITPTVTSGATGQAIAAPVQSLPRPRPAPSNNDSTSTGATVQHQGKRRLEI